MTLHGSLEREIVEKALKERNVRAVSQASFEVHCQFIGQPAFPEPGSSSGRQKAACSMGPLCHWCCAAQCTEGSCQKGHYQLHIRAVTVSLSHVTPPPYVISRLGVHMLGTQKPERCASGNTLHAASDHMLPAATSSIYSVPAQKGQISEAKNTRE